MAKIENKHTWGLKTAARLRAVHASFPDLSPEDRSGYLADEIEYALEDASVIPGETRHSLLGVLDEYFPAYGSDAAPPPAAPATTGPSPPRNVSVAELIDELSSRKHELTPAQLHSLAAITADSNPPPAASPVPRQIAERLTLPASSAEIDDFLKSLAQLCLELGVPTDTDTPLRLNRLLKMLGILSGNFRDIYRFVWPYWSELAPRELKAQVSAAYPNGLEAAIFSFVTGGEVGGGQFHAEVEKTKRIQLSILFGLLKGAEEYGKLYERKFSPWSITDTVGQEEGWDDPAKNSSLARKYSEKCWEKYSQIAKHQTAETIHDEILRAVAEATFTKLKISS